MDKYDISSSESGFCLSVNGKIVLSGVEKISDLLETVSELMDEEAIKTLSRWNFAIQPNCFSGIGKPSMPSSDVD